MAGNTISTSSRSSRWTISTWGRWRTRGLNIFNSKYVLASPETATDRDYELIEAIIAHEYFHNWTGNRITCRDWFQLCLKEGLTVFRDQQFSAHERSEAVHRIGEVKALRARQFREDAGPLAHPVRPEEYVEINNFYTATVYEKGAEVIRMLHTLIGPEAYRKGTDLYFGRHDGQACTIEDWLRVFQDSTRRDLAQFGLWYRQAGTPRVEVAEDWQEVDGVFTVTFRQAVPDTPGQADKFPHVIPIATGLIGPDGEEMLGTEVLELTRAEQSFRFSGLPARPVGSYLRGFSAPVILERETRRCRAGVPAGQRHRSLQPVGGRARVRRQRGALGDGGRRRAGGLDGCAGQAARRPAGRSRLQGAGAGRSGRGRDGGRTGQPGPCRRSRRGAWRAGDDASGAGRGAGGPAGGRLSGHGDAGALYARRRQRGQAGAEEPVPDADGGSGRGGAGAGRRAGRCRQHVRGHAGTARAAGERGAVRRGAHWTRSTSAGRATRWSSTSG